MTSQPPHALFAANGFWHAGLALGRLAEAVRRSPVKDGWALRETAHAVAEAASTEGQIVTFGDLVGAAVGMPEHGVHAPAGHRQAASTWYVAMRAWFGRDFNLRPSSSITADDQTEDDRAPGASVIAALNEPTGLDALYASIDAAIESGASPRAVVLALPPLGTALTGQTLPCLVHAALAREEGPTALAPAADRALERLRALEQRVSTWREQLPVRRRDSRLTDMLDLTVRYAIVTAGLVSEELSVSEQAASAGLRKLESEGIIRPTVTRSRWRWFVPADLYFPEPSVRRVPRRAAPKGTRLVEAALPVLDLNDHDKAASSTFERLEKLDVSDG